MIDAIVISVATEMKSGSELRQCRLEMVAVVDENRCIADVVFPAELTQAHVCES